MLEGIPALTGERFLVVGLGNPGVRYAGTRHNVGFAVLDLLAERLDARFSEKEAWQSVVAEATVVSAKATLLKPQTFMNRSGTAVRAAADWFKVPPERILVVVDDAALPTGHLRLRGQGSSGGHNGLKSVAEHLGGETYVRLRIGVGDRPHPGQDLADHVIGKFHPDEAALMREETCPRAVDAVLTWMKEGLSQAMNKFNQNPKDKE